MVNPYSGHTIARTVYDEDNEAIRTTGAADALPSGEGANTTLNTNIKTSTEVGSNAGDRKAGILIILQDSNAIYIAIGEAATSNHAQLTTEGESIFLPTNDSVYALSVADGGAGSDISYVEM